MTTLWSTAVRRCGSRDGPAAYSSSFGVAGLSGVAQQGEECSVQHGRDLVAYPSPLPVLFSVSFQENGRAGTAQLPGFSDLGQVPYTGCKSP